MGDFWCAVWGRAALRSCRKRENEFGRNGDFNGRSGNKTFVTQLDLDQEGKTINFTYHYLFIKGPLHFRTPVHLLYHGRISPTNNNRPILFLKRYKSGSTTASSENTYNNSYRVHEVHLHLYDRWRKKKATCNDITVRLIGRWKVKKVLELFSVTVGHENESSVAGSR